MLGTVSDEHAILLAEGTLGHMPAYGAAHGSMLVLLVVAAVVLVRWARRGEPARVERVLRSAGWVLRINSALWTLWGVMPWPWDIAEALPLHYSDALRSLLRMAMVTRASWWIVVSWCRALPLSLQSVVTADVHYFVWIPLAFVECWIAHLSGVVGPVVLVWGLRFRPTWRGYGVAYGA